MALGGDLDHPDTSWTVVFFSILVAKLGDTDWMSGLQAGGKTGWMLRCRGELLKVLFQSGVPWRGCRGQHCLASPC